MAVLFIVLLVWLIIIQVKLHDYDNQIEELKKRLDYTNRKLLKILSGKEEITIEEKRIDPIVTESFEEDEEDDDDEFYEEDNIEEKRPAIIYNHTKQEKNSLEKFFLGNAFTIIGALALIIGVGMFIKLISPFFIFTPLMKTIIGFIFGFGLIGTSYAIKKDNLKAYSEVLMGTGFSALFITTLCTTVLFKTFSPATCAIIAGVILIMAYVVADKQKTISMITIALIGGYLNIIFASNMNIDMAFGYLIFLNLLSLIYTYRNPKMECINIINLVITFLLTSILMLTNGKADNIHIAYPIVLWLVYLAYDLISINKTQNPDKINILNWTNFSILTFFSLLIFQDEKLYIGATLLCVAIIYNIIVGYMMYKKSEKFKPYLYSLLITVLLSIYFLAEETTRIALWSIIGLVIAFVVGKLKRDYLANWSIVFFVPAITNLFFINGVTNTLTNYTPIFNDRLFAFTFPIISTLGAYLSINNSENENTLKIAQTIKFMLLSLVYLYIVFEVNNYINENSLLKHSINAMPFVIIGFIYSIQMKKIATTNNFTIFEIASYIVGFISLIMLLIFGINYSPIHAFVPICNIRFVSFVTAIGAAICYARWTNSSFFKYLATILGFYLLNCEAFDFIEKNNTLDINYIISLVWLIYSGIIITFGILKNKSYLKNVGIIISILTLFRIFFYDLRNVDAIYKLIIFIALGTIFMIISYLYNKNQK